MCHERYRNGMRARTGMREWKGKDLRVIGHTTSLHTEIPPAFRAAEAAAPQRFHEGIETYGETPLTAFPTLAAMLGVKGIYAKDESKRFSLNAFKGLGGSYAMFRILCEKLALDPATVTLKDLTDGEYREALGKIEFVTCTDGNHGRGVSWAAGVFGCRAHVFMPCGTREVRAEVIRKVGPADVVITDLSYDDTVLLAKEMGEKNGWILIQDTAWDGYEKIPTWIIQGYLTLASETTEQLERISVRPTHVFLQAGVGAMAGGVLGYLADYYGDCRPVTAIVEPEAANCIFASAEAGDGNAHSVEGIADTMMAGLNCGTPCKVTWPVLRDYADFFISCEDAVAALGMRTYAAGLDGDPAVISGESGAATLGAAVRILSDNDLAGLREEMKLNADSVILLINTEGDTDPENYRRVVCGCQNEIS